MKDEEIGSFNAGGQKKTWGGPMESGRRRDRENTTAVL